MFIILLIVFCIIYFGSYEHKPGTFGKSLLWTFLIFIAGLILSAIGIFPFFG